MNILDDGTVIPSRFKMEETPSFDGSLHFHNSDLRIGEVQETILPNDPRSYSKKFYEYSVVVQHRSRGSVTTRTYSNCLVMNLFGGLADKLVYTLRPDKHGKGQTIGKGSKVLILCINGETNNAIIVGGIRDSQDSPDSDKGHHLDFLFNGISANIDKDGELTVTFNGATKLDGSLADSADRAASGSFIQFQQDGSILLQKDSQLIKIDSSGKVVVLGGDIEATATGRVEVKAASSVLVEAGASASLIAGGAIAVTPGPSAGCTIGDKNVAEPTMMGRSFRQADSSCNSQLTAALQQMTIALVTAGAALSLGDTGTAGTALGQAAAAAAQMAIAIQAYEGVSSTFLSIRNLSD